MTSASDPGSAPWEPDRPLTLESVRGAIRDQFADVDLSTLTHLGSGWEFDAFLTGDGWVFRFPRRSEYARQFTFERGVHALVRSRLRPVQVPEVELEGRPSARFPYAFAGHRCIEGVVADAPGVDAGSELAADLGAALHALHGIDLDEARAAGISEVDDHTLEWVRELRAELPLVRGLDPEVNRAVDWLSAVYALPPRRPGAPRLIHDDLCPDHVIVDPGTGRLVGILDWTDTALGDPMLDFAFLVTWRGWPFCLEVIEAYGGPPDDAFAPRLAFWARAFALDWLVEAYRRGGDIDKHVQWVLNAMTAPI